MATAKKTTTAKAPAPPKDKPVDDAAKGAVFIAGRGFEDGKDGRKFATGSETPIGTGKDAIKQADAERFEKAGHGVIA